MDPLSPILFNLVVDMLAILIERAKDIDNFSGVIRHLVDNGFSNMPMTLSFLWNMI
jgi:hypothetical protein